MPFRGERLLHFEAAPVVRLGHRKVRERYQAISNREIVIVAAGGEAEFEGDWRADADLSRCRGYSERGCDTRLRETGEDAGVGQVVESRQLLAGSPGVLCDLEVEASFLSEEGDQFEATARVYDLVKRRVDRLTKGRRAEDLCRLLCDISIDLDGRLGHSLRISAHRPVSTMRSARQRAGQYWPDDSRHLAKVRVAGFECRRPLEVV